MKKKAIKNQKGFTLVEVIVVLVILAILAAIISPTMIGYIKKANRSALIVECRSCVLAAQTLYSESYHSQGAVTPETIAALADVPGAVSNVAAEDYLVMHLTYTDDSGDQVTYCREPEPCTLHTETFTFEDGTGTNGPGDEEESSSSGDDRPYQQGSGGFYIGDTSVYIKAKGDLTEIARDSGNGLNLNQGDVVYYNGAYYAFKNSQYVAPHTPLDSLLEVNTVPVVTSRTYVVDESTQNGTIPPGAIKQVGDDYYVFTPYGTNLDQYAAHLNQGWWQKLEIQ